ncbi:MAG: hypothetical protein AAF556_04380 [Pseudomonadota bacterium]
MSELSPHRDDDPTVAQLLARIEKHAVIQPPATGEEIDHAQRLLAPLVDVALPQDFRDFLGLANGLNWNGIQLFGTEDVPRPHRNYTMPSLSSANSDPGLNVGGPGQLIVGTTGDEWLVLGPADGGILAYHEIDRVDGDIYRSAATLRRLLTRLIKERMA